jgi:hypothetical protein
VPLDDPPPLELLVDDPPPSGVGLPLSELLHAGSSSPTPMAHSHGDQTRCSKACAVCLGCMRFSLECSCDRSPRPIAVARHRLNGSRSESRALKPSPDIPVTWATSRVARPSLCPAAC